MKSAQLVGQVAHNEGGEEDEEEQVGQNGPFLSRLIASQTKIVWLQLREVTCGLCRNSLDLCEVDHHCHRGSQGLGTRP